MTGIERALTVAQKKGLLLDTNLFVLYLVGQTEEGMVEKHKRTSRYTLDDYRLLLKIVHSQPRLVTTPHVLAEVSNLAAFQGKLQERFHRLFEAHIQKCDSERYFSGKEICVSPAFRKLGVTDTGIVLLATEGIVVMTDDLELHVWLGRNGAASINFTHLQGWNLGLPS